LFQVRPSWSMEDKSSPNPTWPWKSLDKVVPVDISRSEDSQVAATRRKRLRGVAGRQKR
jgi:hypothetical protein